MKESILSADNSAGIILCLAVILFSGFLLTRITKKLKLPNVTGYILAGVLIGPYLLNVIPVNLIMNMSFLTDIALAYIAFGVGKYFKLSTLKKTGKKVIIITIFESLIAGAVVTLTMLFIFKLPLSFSLLLGAIGCATAPASTIMTIRQYHAKGEFVDVLLQVVALDDAVALIAFSVCTAIINLQSAEQSSGIIQLIQPIVLNVAVVILGGFLGWVLVKAIHEHRSQEHAIVLVNGVLLVLSAICSYAGISPLLACMALGTTYINLHGNKDLFKQVNRFSPPILLIFFVLSGMNLNVPALYSAGLIGVAYFLVRIAGKYVGAWLGCRASGCSVEMRNYLGLALIPQAGVSIGLAVLGQRLLPTEMGILLSTIILSSGVMYEMIGPVCAKAALFLSKTIRLNEEVMPNKTDLDNTPHSKLEHKTA